MTEAAKQGTAIIAAPLRSFANIGINIQWF